MGSYSENKWFGRQKRPDWAGPVIIETEEIVRPKGTVERTRSICGIVVPSETAGRPSAPEPASGFRIGAGKKIPKTALALSPRNTGYVDMDKGHLMALELGGPDVGRNICPQFSQFQRNGVWRQMETKVLKRASELADEGCFLKYMAYAMYYDPKNLPVGWLSLPRLLIPQGFRVVTVVLDEDQQPLKDAKAVEMFHDEQAPSEVDDKMFLRTLAKIGEIKPGMYDDLVWAKGKPEFVEAGQDARHAPELGSGMMIDVGGPPIVYPSIDTSSTAMFGHSLLSGIKTSEKVPRKRQFKPGLDADLERKKRADDALARQKEARDKLLASRRQSK
ncbi:MAG: hypothetical protein JO264_20900 [Acidisphaera sp.]|nr:hypothetical protein [Acidisphaera sp.]